MSQKSQKKRKKYCILEKISIFAQRMSGNVGICDGLTIINFK